MNDGVSPLCITSKKKTHNIIQLLFPNCANFNIWFKNNTSSLYAACFWGHCSIAQFLLNNRGDVNQCMNDGSSPLYGSVFVGMTAFHSFYWKRALI